MRALSRRLIACFALAVTLTSFAHADTIKIATQPWLGYGPLWIAEKQGYFKQRGVDVKIVNFTYDQDMSAALASGDINIGCGATNSLIALVNNGLDVVGFLLMDASYEADAILAPRTVASIGDLKGKSVAFEAGSTSDLLLHYALQENGLGASDIKAVQMPAADAGLAVISGRVDIAVTYEPYISAALKDHSDYHVLYSAAARPGLISDVLVADRKFVDENLDAIRKIALAWDDAITFIREHPEDGGRIIAEAVGSPMEEFNVAFQGVHLYDLKENREQFGGAFQASFTTIAEILHGLKPDEIHTVPDPTKVIDTRAVAE